MLDMLVVNAAQCPDAVHFFVDILEHTSLIFSFYIVLAEPLPHIELASRVVSPSCDLASFAYRPRFTSRFASWLASSRALRPFSLPSHITSFTLRSRFILASLSLRSRFVLAMIVTFHSLPSRFVAHSGSLPSRLVLGSDSRRSRFIISWSSVICGNSFISCSAYRYTLNSINQHLVSTIFSVPCLISTVEQALELHR